MARRNATLDTPLGELLVVADARTEGASAGDGTPAEAIVGLYFPEHWHPPAPGSIGERVDAEADPLFRALAGELDAYLAGERTAFQTPAFATGDPFQQAVWGMLREIPYGETITYGALATRLGDPNLARRVGGAVGRNPVSILIPCHRVVGASGSLTGYAGGLERKRQLLELEGAAVVAQRQLF